jgi:enterochelin esterase-like enzyme
MHPTRILAVILALGACCASRAEPDYNLGTVHYHRAFHGRGLADRDLIVWLPPGYDGGTGERYPVLYMQDGQNILDPATSAFGVSWGVDTSVRRMIRGGGIPPLIIVGIYNTKNREDEYMPGPLAETYMDFMVGTLKPFIDSTYRTRPGRGDTMVAGASSGGTLAFMLVWEHPDVFSRAMCMSPAFKIEKWDYVGTVLATTHPPRDIRLYMDVGTVELEAKLEPGVEAMRGALERRGYRAGTDFFVVHDPGAKHQEAAWGRRFPGALQSLMGR